MFQFTYKTLFFLASWSAVQGFNGYAIPGLLATQPECIPVEIKECKTWYDSMRPLDMYSSTTTEYEAGKKLIHQLSILPKQFRHCAKDAMFLLCSMYSPVCFKNSGILKPCREVCTNWMKTCGQSAIFKYVALPMELKSCQDLPEHHSSVCIKPDTFFTMEQEKKDKRVKTKKGHQNKIKCDCQNYKMQTPKYRHFKKSDYVIEASVTSKETLSNGNVKILVKVKQILKQGNIKVNVGKLRMWSNCFCQQHVEYGYKYYIMGDENIKKNKLEINTKTFILPYEEYKEKMKKWNDKCLKRSCNDKHKEDAKEISTKRPDEKMGSNKTLQ